LYKGEPDMPTTELITNVIGTMGRWEVHEPNDQRGNAYPDSNAWLSAKIAAGITGITNVTNQIVVCNNHGRAWEAFDEPHPNGTIRTIFEIT
jgi:hypothetical protein